MQWDHLPGFEKGGDIAGPWLAGRTPAEILAEIAKCELVCTNCHTLRTFARNGWGNRSPEAPPHARQLRVERWRDEDELDPSPRTCAMCGLTKPATEFHRSRTGQFSYCRDCRCAYDRRYYAERGKPDRLARQRSSRDVSRTWMDSLKGGRPCADCGGTFSPWAMHWDHLPEFVKVDEVSSMVASLKRARVLEEIGKCELVCANCHVMRTVRRAKRTISEDEGDYWFAGSSAT